MKKFVIILVILLSVKIVDAQTVVKCHSCNGAGHKGVCLMCAGRGAIPTMYGLPAPCPGCLGMGRIICYQCAGQGGWIIYDQPTSTPYVSGEPYINQGSSPSYNSGSNSSSSSKKHNSICMTCKGSGKCIGCHGSGFRTDNAFGTGVDYSKKCGVCGGRGICNPCKGSGYH